MENTNQKGETLQTTDSVGVTETQNVRAIGINKTKTGFNVHYENGKTITFDIGYMDMQEYDFDEDGN